MWVLDWEARKPAWRRLDLERLVRGKNILCQGKEHAMVSECTLGTVMLWTIVNCFSGTKEFGSLVYGDTVRKLEHRDCSGL